MYAAFVPHLQSCHIKKKLEFLLLSTPAESLFKTAARSYTIVAGLVDSKVVWNHGDILHGQGSVLKPTVCEITVTFDFGMSKVRAIERAPFKPGLDRFSRVFPSDETPL
jgi:hypothetical protein